jgi:hypothetical protein
MAIMNSPVFSALFVQSTVHLLFQILIRDLEGDFGTFGFNVCSLHIIGGNAGFELNYLGFNSRDNI